MIPRYPVASAIVLGIGGMWLLQLAAVAAGHAPMGRRSAV